MRFVYFFAISLVLLHSSLFGQDSVARDVSWKFSSTKTGDGRYALSASASINGNWRVFSTKASDDDPNTRIVFDSATTSILNVSAIDEKGGLIQEKEPLFENLEISYYDEDFQIEINGTVSKLPASIRGSVQYMAMKGDLITSPVDVPFYFHIAADGSIETREGGLQQSAAALNELRREKIDLANPVNNCGGTGLEDSGSGGLWGIFILGFVGGLVGLLTPCVFPMIPLTVSFFTKKSGNRKRGIANASLYGFFILAIYVVLSIPFHFVDSSNPEILNNISTNMWLNILFFLIFVVFALSFFGLFEINMPSSLANKTDEKAGVGGIAGIFFMALTLALVSFSCTGPILGSLLAGSLSTNGGAIQLTMGMAGFGLALALPFALFAMFPNWLGSLPKSGGWLTSVKIVLGFLELAFAIKFLSNADLVAHWGILKREVFFGAWVIIGLLLSLYLFGIIRFPHEGRVKLTRLRIALGVVFLAFTIYLIPGLTKTRHANRSLVSGFPPPLTYSVYGKDAFKGVEANVMNNYEQALALAKEQNKPLLIDFTGWACVNCRRMEENVWTVPEVQELIEKNFVLVSLYVDDRQKLPAEEQFIYTFADSSTKKIETIGNKFETFQNLNFRSISQPLYVIVSPDERLLNRPVGYMPDADEYAAWLKCGLEAYNR